MAKNQVIIIGGGVSGLTAANELIDNGINNIILIEAQNRLGGRIYSIPAADKSHVIEIGAQWIHGEKKNPIYDLCNKIGMVDKETKTIFGDKMYYATQDGKKVDDDDVEQIFEKLEIIFDEIEDEAEEMQDNDDRSLGSMIETKFSKFLNNLRIRSKLNSEKVEIIKSIYKARLKEEMAQNACANLNELSVVGWNEYIDCDGDDMVNLKNGYSQLIKYLASKIPPERIVLNEIVTKIQWPSDTKQENFDDHVVIVTTYNTVTKTECFYYGYQCICTMSLGCLKATHKDLFVPKLPSSKINSIENLGFGVVNKVFLIFDRPLFQDDVQGLQVLWRDDLYLELETVKKYKLQNQTFFKSFSTFEAFPKKRNILYTFIVGDDAKYVEELENPILLEVLYEMLSKCFVEIDIPKPVALMKSAWSSNNFVKGSYSYVKVNSTINDIRNLTQPICSKLHFAGEHTDYKFLSTVHGAYQSGLRAARNAIKIFTKEKK